MATERTKRVWPVCLWYIERYLVEARWLAGPYTINVIEWLLPVVYVCFAILESVTNVIFTNRRKRINDCIGSRAWQVLCHEWNVRVIG